MTELLANVWDASLDKNRIFVQIIQVLNDLLQRRSNVAIEIRVAWLHQFLFIVVYLAKSIF